MAKDYNKLINFLIEGDYLKTPYIIKAFKKIDRRNFILPEYKEYAYDNEPLPIGFNQTISQPSTVAFMIETLAPKSGQKILEIGAGSGWQTAILSEIVKPKGKVIALELIPELTFFAKKNVSQYNFVKKGTAQIINADGSKGYKKEAPFDKIISGAAAFKEIPRVWRDQLKIRGRIVAPVDRAVVVIDKLSKNNFSQEEYPGFVFVPLITQ